MSVTIEEAQAKLRDYIAGLPPGERIIIVDNGQPVATLARSDNPSTTAKAGCYRKEGFWMAPDFDDPLDEFKEYME